MTFPVAALLLIYVCGIPFSQIPIPEKFSMAERCAVALFWPVVVLVLALRGITELVGRTQ